MWLKVAEWRVDTALESNMEEREKHNQELGKRICSVYRWEKIPDSYFIIDHMLLFVWKIS